MCYIWNFIINYTNVFLKRGIYQFTDCYENATGSLGKVNPHSVYANCSLKHAAWFITSPSIFYLLCDVFSCNISTCHID